VRELIQKVKESEFDYEFYPTTSEIIKIINSDIHRQYSKFEISILDIGAGNGNFFKILESLHNEIRSPEEASKEMDIPLSEIINFYGSNLQLAISQYNMLA